MLFRGAHFPLHLYEYPAGARVLALALRFPEHGSQLDPVPVGVLEAGLDRDERPDRHGRPQLHLDAARERKRSPGVDGERHRLVERRRDHAAVREPGRALVVLLDEEPPSNAWLLGGLDLELEAKEVGQATAEAEIVMPQLGCQIAPPAGSGAAGSSLAPPGFSRAMYSSSVIGNCFTRSATSSSSVIVATSSTCSFRNHCTNCSLR